MTRAGTWAATNYPKIHEALAPTLTGYGLSVVEKQMSAGSKYGTLEVDFAYLTDTMFEVQPGELQAASDRADLVEHPRFRTADELRAAVPAGAQRDGARAFQVDLFHTVSLRPASPHFVVLHDKVPGRECYMRYLCTCGSGVWCGACRHYWAVHRHSTAPAFHAGLVNDMWFMVVQPLQPAEIKLFDDPSVLATLVEYERPLYPSLDTGSDEPEDSDNLPTKKRIWGALLGEAKKAIERSIDLGYQDGLYATLKGFSTATGDSASTGAFETGEALTTLVVRNPDVVRGKGRPKMTIRVRVATGKRLENSRQPLHELANRGSRAASMEGDGTPRADSGGASAGAGSAPISS
eukprot:CAMPEP_0117696332 /NCGR_PEP_ID=MMETSP0804-20121206/28622_1 /TAXON_ID=1074897 /ORGANISM="Tetraselmis astigmatica, Strain CCMP880" /LENGTH=349 /DNA_ID=CAMNT_0005510475 /DNA_START=1276 /DNA_END=2323 /DNA_ORIENTATION=-